MSDSKTRLVIPSAINILALSNDIIIRNRRRGLSTTLGMPSLRSRARMIVGEVGVVPVEERESVPTIFFTR